MKTQFIYYSDYVRWCKSQNITPIDNESWLFVIDYIKLKNSES